MFSSVPIIILKEVENKMRKIIAALLALGLIFVLESCGDNKSENDEIIQGDTSVMAMSFTPPGEYESLERIVEHNTDGTVTEKYMVYTLSDDTKISYQYLTGIRFSQLINKKKAEKLEQDGHTFYLKHSKGVYQAFTKAGGGIYSLLCSVADNERGREIFDDALSGVSFTEAEKTGVNGFTVCDLNYKVSGELSVQKKRTSLTQNSDGKLLKKSVMLYFGETEGKTDFRFEMIAFKNTTIKEIVGKERKYKYQTIGKVQYAAMKSNEAGVPYAYYTQQDDDVYEIVNIGVNDGLFTTRSSKSEKEFTDFMKNIYFK